MSLFKVIARHERTSAAAVERARSAVHSGSMGDVLYALPAAKALGVTRFVLNVCVDPAIGGRALPQSAAEFLAPLLLGQGAVGCVEIVRAAVEFVDGDGRLISEGMPLERVDSDALGFDHVFDRFRLDPDVLTKHLVLSHADAVGVAVDPAAPFIGLEDLAERRARANDEDAPVVVSLTPRYRRLSTGYFARLLQGRRNIVKIGLPGEADMYQGIPGEFRSVGDALELARLLASARLFVGVPSMPYAIAEGLKIPRAIDVPEDIPNAFPLGAAGWRLPADMAVARRLLDAAAAGDADAAAAAERTAVAVPAPETRLAVFWRPGEAGWAADRSVAATYTATTTAPRLVCAKLPPPGGALEEVAVRLADLPGWYEVGSLVLRDAAGAVLWRLEGNEAAERLLAERERVHEAPVLLAATDSRLHYWQQPEGGGLLPLPLDAPVLAALKDGGSVDVFLRRLSKPEADVADEVEGHRARFERRGRYLGELLRHRDEELRERDRELGERDRELRERDGELQRQRREHDQRVADISAELARAQGDLERTRGEIAAVYASTSWRVTGPLRRSVLAQRAARVHLKKALWLLLHGAWRALPLGAGTRGRIGNAIWHHFGPLLRHSPVYRDRFEQGVAETPLVLPPAQPQPRGLTIHGTGHGTGSAAPLVSVVIPVYNKIEYTLACLDSIAEHPPSFPFEVIVVDDGSSDATQATLEERNDIVYVRNRENLGFVGSCNAGATAAKGRFLFFLNNDTTVVPGWLDSLVETVRRDPTIGLAGSKLIYPDGRLQEAGGIVFEDASGWNFGRFGSPDAPSYGYLRDVDYCSGAAILVARDLFEELGGFDPLYKPAYYEDTDLAFKVREQAGLRTVYQPLSQIFHFEGITSGTDLTTGVKAYQVANREKFLDRWKDVLAAHGSSGEPARAVFDRRPAGRVLVVDACTPTPDRDSGSLDMANLLQILTALGLRVTFVPESNFLHFGSYTEALQRIGVECLFAPHVRSVEEVLRKRGGEFDLVVLTRGPVAAKYVEMVRHYAPRARLVFNTVDLHFLREERQAALEGRPLGSEAKRMKREELSIIQQSDATIVVSRYEGELLGNETPGARIDVIPVIRAIPGRAGGRDGRDGIVFIGGFLHPPNADAVQFFLREVWPLVRAELPQAVFRIVGSHMPDSIKALADDGGVGGVEVLGFVEDLDPVFNHCLMTVAPLRYGAGIKGKVATSLGYGVPCVATSIAVEGTGMADGREVLVANEPEAMAAAIVRLHRDRALWDSLSDAGIAFCRDYFALPPNLLKVANMLAGLGLYGKGSAGADAFKNAAGAAVVDAGGGPGGWSPFLSERTLFEVGDLGPWSTGWEALAQPRRLVVVDHLPADAGEALPHLERAAAGVAPGGALLFTAVAQDATRSGDAPRLARALRRAGFAVDTLPMGPGAPFLWIARRPA